MHPLNKTARLAGMFYLLVVISGFFTLMYVPGKLFVTNDASATASNILAHQTLFRAYIVADLISGLAFIATVLALYQLFESVGRRLAMLMVLLVLLVAPLGLVGTANQLAALILLRSSDLLGAFDPAQRNALAMLLLKLNGSAKLISEVFWGLWLLPLGLLTCRSGFVPRLLGVWLIINGLTYVAMSAIGLAWPHYPDMIDTITAPLLLGEVAFTFWLLIVGIRTPSSGIATT
ncbi:MAG: DUF4386 domain-containing protein [Rhodanobacter sp.]